MRRNTLQWQNDVSWVICLTIIWRDLYWRNIRGCSVTSRNVIQECNSGKIVMYLSNRSMLKSLFVTTFACSFDHIGPTFILKYMHFWTGARPVLFLLTNWLNDYFIDWGFDLLLIDRVIDRLIHWSLYRSLKFSPTRNYVSPRRPVTSSEVKLLDLSNFSFFQMFLPWNTFHLDGNMF